MKMEIKGLINQTTTTASLTNNRNLEPLPNDRTFELFCGANNFSPVLMIFLKKLVVHREKC
jgi:hypothetical protein